MHALKSTILFLLCATVPILAVAAEPPSTLQQAREWGRAKSRFLKDRPAKTNNVEAPKANIAHFKKSIAPVLRKSCLSCHGPERSEGRLRVDQLDPNLLVGDDVQKWREIYNALSNSEMPPEDEPDSILRDSDRGNIVDWLGAEMGKASLVRRNSKQHSSFRRMTKYEYNYALQDLLGLGHELPNNLPPETASEDGFKNNSELLQMSPMQFQAYREIGREALKRATVSDERPATVSYAILMRDEFAKTAAQKKAKAFDLTDKNARNMRRRQHVLDQSTGKGVQFSGSMTAPKRDGLAEPAPPVSPVVLVLPRSNSLKLNLDRFLPDEGVMRVRIRAGRSTMKDNEFASLRLVFSAHTSNNANFSEVISKSDAPVSASAEQPEFIDFEIPLSDMQRNPFRKLATRFPRRDEFLTIQNISNANDRDEPLKVHIDYIEITAPFYAQWPPKSHRAIFFESPNKSDEATYAREVLTRFLRRVWRRPVEPPELAPWVALFEEYRPEFPKFEDAMLEVLATALTTPEFLYLTQKSPSPNFTASKTPTSNTPTSNSPTSNSPTTNTAPAKTISVERERVSDLELASRMAIFLWSSIPDEELLAKAEQGDLSAPDVLAGQVKRMLADPRSKRFSQNFVRQWLGLDGLRSATHVTDEALKNAMREEPVAFFEELLRRDGSVIDFIHGDYVVINERLANHYRIPNVYGPHFRQVPLPQPSQRGGVLTTAATLTMNSDGKDSHPLKRGIWMLERILQDPPPPPPPNVPEVDLTDPEILKMTLKERIADHRNKPACISCHAKIDPWGIAFENYDAVGAFRTTINRKPIDATSKLFNKQELAGMPGLKRYLLMERQDQFARAMAEKMTAYALGRSLSFSDHADIDDLTAKFRKRGDRLSDLIHLIIQSDLFNSK